VFVIVGYIVVLAAVFGGFAANGGHLAALWQPLELVMIFGAAIGAFFVGNNPKAVKATLKALPTLFKGSKYTRDMYMELMSLMFDVLSKVRKEGLMSIEGDIETPEQSPVFSKYPAVLADHHIVEFITDYLRLMVSGNMDAFQIENLMDNEIETHHHEGLPAFGIVAAVMGVVHTMESVGLPPAELGILIAHALVGTFLGILLAYGFVGPLASLLEQKLEESTKMFQTVKVTLLASLNGYAPALAVEFGRKVLYSTERPTFAELEDHIKKAKAK
jgi:chemotaxis protein MotA